MLVPDLRPHDCFLSVILINLLTFRFFGQVDSVFTASSVCANDMRTIN